MRLAGRRVHIAGSASRTTPEATIAYAHQLVATLADVLLNAGATVAVGIGHEPTIDPTDPESLPLVFDWTVLNAVAAYVDVAGERDGLLAVVASSKTEQQIPSRHREMWERLRGSKALHLAFVDAGWTAGAVRRTYQSQLADILIALGGGEGVEHLAQLYAQQRKPVIPLDLQLGGATDDGCGGSAALFNLATSHPSEFAAFQDPSSAARLYADTTTANANRRFDDVVAATLRLIEGCLPPRAFLVRVLDRDSPDFDEVERFFRGVVEPVLTARDYVPVTMPEGAADEPWLNVAIFDGIAGSHLVVADLTGLRPNCLIEMGYALGRGIPTLVTARHHTTVPFDARMLEIHAWNPDDGVMPAQDRLSEYTDRTLMKGPVGS